MAIQLHDTLAGRKRELVPLVPGRIGLYACGPTVYDLSHLGHARCYVVWDVVVRHLRARGYQVKYVRNFTDVDDKIIRRARESGEDPMALAARFAQAYLEDMDALGNLRPEVAPSVSSQDKDFKTNADGSVDVWFGPKAPPGMERNWVQTIPGKGWFMILRLYGPLEPWFNKTWRPGEIELQP